MAEGVLQKHLKRVGLSSKVKVGSAGTLAGRPGARADSRAAKVAAVEGVKLGKIRARRASTALLASNDLVIALDEGHYEALLRICPPGQAEKIGLLLDYLADDAQLKNVPDPYYGSADGFKQVYELIDRAVLGMLPTLTAMAAKV